MELTQLDRIAAIWQALQYEKDIQDGLRDQLAAKLMTDLERIYSIPMLKNEDFEKKNPEVMRVYLDISNGRKFV